MPSQTHRRAPGGFSLVELLVVISLILILMGILFPVIKNVRSAARTAQTKAFLDQLSRAIENYSSEFRAFPGPLSNTEVWNGMLGASQAPFTQYLDITGIPSGYATMPAAAFRHQITMSENLVLGLLGGLKVDTSGGVGSEKLVYDPTLVGNGPNSLTLTGSKHYNAFIEATNLSWGTTARDGHFADAAGSAADTIIPEFVDTYDEPMPILYLRARKGAVSTASPPVSIDNTVATYDSGNSGNPRRGQYDVHQIIGYTGSFTGNWPASTLVSTSPEGGKSIGVGKKSITYLGAGSLVTQTPGFQQYHGLRTADPAAVSSASSNNATYNFPLDAYPYFRNQSMSSPPEANNYGGSTLVRNDVAHQKDGFILIAAGPDRIYGTRDDITNFGEVGK